ncbi:TonB-dependent siderophore receptor [Nostoc sp. PA-18-2419]|uniref:TonB-dependent siderophore receptor n=1 Tax=Nostoc sp. PA-18-2419 TaxID=2575443 RepID=UPI001109EC45|nr:TonB-dependent siderophore receptor [Nostoc sp. PA-18-2419]
MVLNQILKIILVTSSIWLCIGISVRATEVNKQVQGKFVASALLNSRTIREIPRLGKVGFPSTSAQQLVQAPAPQTAPTSEVVQVTGVKANPTDKGVEIILQTSIGQQLQVVNRSAGNSFITDIPNAQLRLPSGEAFTFRSDKPITGVNEITVTNLDANTIRVTVTGEAGLPIVELFDSDEGLIFGLTPVTSSAQMPQQPPVQQPGTQTKPDQPLDSQTDKPIELVVTGEQDEYRVPNASTATGTDTPIRDIPFSIQVVPQEIIRDQQVTRTEEALRNVSGVTNQGNGNNRNGADFSIRGFTDAPILRDGLRRYGVVQAPLEVANLERIEVLKGPASILYGAIEPGGLINAVSKQPLSEPFYETELQVGNQGFVRPRFDFSGPLTEDGKLLYRLNGLYQRLDSFRNLDQEDRRIFIAPTLAWKIDDRTDLGISLEYIDNNRPADFGIPAIGNRIADVPRDRINSEPSDAVTNEYLNVGYNLEHRFNQNWKFRNAFRYSSYDYDFNVVALPLSFDEPTSTVNRFFASQEGYDKNYTLQANVVGEFATGSINHTLLFGADYNHSDATFFTVFDFNTPLPLNLFNPVYGVAKPSEDTLPPYGGSNTTSNRWGFYLQDQISLFQNLKLLAGIRYDIIESKTVNLPGQVTQPGETTQNDDAFTPRVGIVYQPSKAVSLYASYSESFTPNTTNTATGEPLQPQRGKGYEFGVKTEFLDGKLFATLAYFDITKQNVSVTDPNFPLASIASGEQRSHGVEFDVAGEILPGWKIIANYAYIDGEVTADTNPELVGNRLYGVPEHSASLWTTYEIQRGNLQGLGLGVGFNYVGQRQGDLANSFQVDSYLTTNAAIFYRRNNWRFGLNFKNLTDVNYIESVSNLRSGGNTFGEPFTVIGSVSVQF